MIPGGFEEAAIKRRLRERLWRAVWVQQHAYDEWDRLTDLPGVRAMEPRVVQAARAGDESFEWACEEQRQAVAQAEQLGFAGRQAWIEASRVSNRERRA